MYFNESDLSLFRDNIWSSSFLNNHVGMGAPDMFSFWFILNKYRPSVVIESGVWNGISTKLIRKTLPNSTIICLDPRNIPSTGYTDDNKKTIYYIGKKFIDFKNLDLSHYNNNDILCFFDDHINCYSRLIQYKDKKINKIFFNDNYPVKSGSHYTIEHLIHNDNRFYNLDTKHKNQILNLIDIYHIFPNIYPGLIKTDEGDFKCDSYYTNVNNKYPIYLNERLKYMWNTFVTFKDI